MKRANNEINNSNSSSSAANDNWRTPAPRTTPPDSDNQPNIFQRHQENQATNEELTLWKNSHNILSNLFISAYTQPLLISRSESMGPSDSTPTVTIKYQFSEQAFGTALASKDFKTCIDYIKLFPTLFHYQGSDRKKTILMIAAQEKYIELFKLLPVIVTDEDTRLRILHQKDQHRNTTLMHAAATKDNVEVISELLNLTSIYNLFSSLDGSFDFEALDIACRQGSKNNLQTMMNALNNWRLLDLNKKYGLCNQHLMFAAEYGCKDIVERELHNAGMFSLQLLFSKDKSGNTALMYAAMNNHTDVIELLLKSCANKDIMEELVREGNFDNYTALTLASEYGAKEAISILLKSVSDPVGLILIKQINGEGALGVAAGNHDTAGLDMLLDPLGPEGISDLIKRWDYTNEDGSPLVFATCFGHLKFARTVLSMTELNLAAIMMLQDGIKASALHRAVVNQMFDIIPDLFNALPDNAMKQQFAELINDDQETALMLATKFNDVRSIGALFAHIPDPRRLMLMTNTNGETVMQLARRLGNLDVIRVLESVFPEL